MAGLTREERTRPKYAARIGRSRPSLRRKREKRLGARERLSRVLSNMQQKQMEESRRKKIMDDIVKERNKRKAQEKIREAREKGLLSQKELKTAQIIKDTQERLRQDLKKMIKNAENDRNSELQRKGFKHMEAGQVKEAIETFQEGNNGALGNEYAEIDSRIADDLKKLKKEGGDKVVRTSMKDMLSMAVPADSIYKKEENHQQRNLEEDRTKKSTNQEISQELQRKIYGEAHAGR